MATSFLTSENKRAAQRSESQVKERLSKVLS